MSDEQLTPDTSRSDFAISDFDIAPEDAELAASIENFDPLTDIPSPVEWTGGDIKVPEALTADMLPPEKRHAVRAQLGSLSGPERARREDELTRAALQENSLHLRVKAGGGSGTNPYQREALVQARERYDLDQAAWRIEIELAELEGWSAEFDPATGGQKPVPVHKVTGERRRALERQRDEIAHRLSCLDGIEGQRRLEQARFEAVREVRSVQAQLEEYREAKQRAVHLAREQRINESAERKARFLRSNLN